MPLAPTSRRRSLIAQVTDQLRAQIRSGEWRVGTRIPTEFELAAAFGVSRNTVREAVQALMQVGVLERRQGSGTYVTATSELAGLVALRVAGGEIAEAIEVRQAIDTTAARLASRRRDDADLERLESALARLRAAWDNGDAAAFVDADTDLHIAVVLAAHNSLLSDLYVEFSASLRTAIAATVGDALKPEFWRDHAPLVDAIRRGDGEAAAASAAAVSAAAGAVMPR